MEKKLCISMFVSGRYQYYIPLFLYFLKHSYPEYFALIAYKEKLSYEVLESVKLLGGGNFVIKENVFNEYPNDINLEKTLRWVMEFDEYGRFDYIYNGDIDIMLVRENPTLLERHLAVCEKNKSFHSNTVWMDDFETRGKRMTGIHFFREKEYFAMMRPVVKKYARILMNGNPPEFYNEKIGRYDNQHALYVMMKEAGIDMNDCVKPEDVFFEYGGIHLGHSRFPGRWEEFFTYDIVQQSYYNKFREVFADKLFWALYFRLPVDIQSEIDEVISKGELLCRRV